ncbi:MAG TPA: hypothetical protein VEC06_19815 [Paucimonas sp.]|nr:hypothetical protein [Paucimonas sp.]
MRALRAGATFQMKMEQQHYLILISMTAAGFGIGASAAWLLGLHTWPEAKSFVSLGTVSGWAVGKLMTHQPD